MRPYYEGWYMKQQQGGDILAVIPGRAQDEAFIQVVTADGAHYLPFPLETSAKREPAACAWAAACSRPSA